ncbi:MAG: cation diffusion facilitator family transporter [Bacteroidota bacterium]
MPEKKALPERDRVKTRALQIVLAAGILLMAVKFAAYFITHSVAVLSDALESIINVAAGGFALYSIYYSLRPRDLDHPYGHGKIENLSAGFEGGLILVAGLGIIVKAIYSFFYPPELEKLDMGLLLAGFAGLCNFIMGAYLVRNGKKYHSMVLIADGKHLISDTVSSIGLLAGLALIWLTGLYWIDNVVALIFGGAILYTGIKLIREAVSGLLDKADVDLLQRLIEVLNKHRRDAWIDIHNLRVIKYGSGLHVDAHLTLPWYFSLEQAHREINMMERLVRTELGDEIEFFIHADPCPPASCPLCLVAGCAHRKHDFVKKIEWELQNLLPDTKHRLG